ncbi:MAG: cytidylyltransferase domain-containing protein [Aequorivita sp.]
MAIKKIAIIIQARMQSTRLPGKVMLPLPLKSGKPLLGWVVDGLQKVTLEKDIIVATTQHPEDDAIVSFCQFNKVQYYRGSEKDVLSRYQEITEKGDYEHIVRYTADNPFVDSEIIKSAIDFHIENDFDITYTTGLPLGVHVEIIKRKPLLELTQVKLSEMDREHVTLYLLEHEKYKKGAYKHQVNPKLQDLRVTVDYPSDFLVASSILGFSEGGKDQGISLIEKVYNQYPWIFEANKGNFHKNPTNSLSAEVEEAKRVLTRLDLNRAVKLLDKNKKA